MKVYVVMVNSDVRYDDDVDYILGVYSNIDKAKEDILKFYKSHPKDMEFIKAFYEEYCEENPDINLSLEEYILDPETYYGVALGYEVQE